jgi:hypothetical protein
VVSRDRFFFHGPTRSPATFSDLFRYEGLRRKIGTWVDLDMLFLRNISDMGEHIFSWQTEEIINGAVLRLPVDCPLFDYVEKLVASPVPLPRHWPLRKKIKQLIRRRSIEQLEKSVIGPLALTDFLRRSGEARLAQAPEVFYPLRWQDRLDIFDPRIQVEARFTSETRAVHLWNTLLDRQGQKNAPPPRDSFLARMCERYDIQVASHAGAK